MKKLIFLCVALLVAPAMADVEFDGTNNGSTITITYECVDMVETPRGMALLLTCDEGMTITGMTADSVDPAYNCFLDWAYSNDPYDLGDGDPFADPAGPGVGTLPAAEISICMGVLDEDGNQAAGPVAAQVIELTVDGSADLTVSADTLRGPDSGVVGSALASNLPIVIPGGDICLTEVTAIFPAGHPRAGQSYYQEWLDVGSPQCWCYARQCWGDAAGDRTGTLFTGYTWVGLTDLDIFALAWNVLEPDKGPGIDSVPNGICADFNHDLTGTLFTGYTRVGLTDLTIFAATWNVLEPDKGPGIPGDCGGTLSP
jgi:hypothetical protein